MYDSFSLKFRFLNIAYDELRNSGVLVKKQLGFLKCNTKKIIGLCFFKKNFICVVLNYNNSLYKKINKHSKINLLSCYQSNMIAQSKFL